MHAFLTVPSRTPDIMPKAKFVKLCTVEDSQSIFLKKILRNVEGTCAGIFKVIEHLKHLYLGMTHGLATSQKDKRISF